MNFLHVFRVFFKGFLASCFGNYCLTQEVVFVDALQKVHSDRGGKRKLRKVSARGLFKEPSVLRCV